MGSIVMHLCASNEANKILKLDIKRFLIGSIAPDIHKISGGSYSDTHYIINVDENNRHYELPDVQRFLNENYENILKDDYYKGYYAHLIADKIWYKDFTTKYVDILLEDKSQVKLIGHDEFIPYEKYRNLIYTDYSNINNNLLTKYHINTDLLYNIAILNINSKDIKKLISFNISTPDGTNDNMIQTNLIDINDIYDWIEKSKDEIIKRLLELRK